MRRDFFHGMELATSLPTRFHLNLTERCPLRCLHCITQAPMKTEHGIARSMLPEVLGALSWYLSQARHISLCHAGEPMLSPAFRPLMELVASARHRPIVHLMSNGLALTENRFLWAAERGLRSLVISVDGLSPQTHDRLRVGSSIRRLGATLQTLNGLRRQRSLPVRLGISWTVNKENLPELEFLPEQASDWGVDAIKVEELVNSSPTTDALGPVADTELMPVLESLRYRCDSMGIVFVDHTRERRVVRCQARTEEAVERLFRGDDFINSDTIHPCHAPYDTVYVEPDGTVKPVSFHHRGAGNLLQQPLEEIWNGEIFRGWRRLAARRRVCANEPDCGGRD